MQGNGILEGILFLDHRMFFDVGYLSRLISLDAGIIILELAMEKISDRDKGHKTSMDGSP